MQLPRLRRPLVLLTSAGLAAAGLFAGSVQAATSPGTVTLPSTPGSHHVTFHGTAPFNNGQANLLFDDVTGACNPNDPNGQTFRDEHHVKVNVPSSVDPKLDVLIRFQIDWTPHPTDTEPTQDLRMDLFGPDGNLVGSSDSSQTSEGVSVTAPVGGIYDMVVCAFQTTPDGQDYTGTVTASLLKPPPAPQASGVKAPRFRQFEAPKGKAKDAGEPSIGNDWKTGRTLFTAYTEEYRVAFHPQQHTSTWTLVNDDVADPSNKISLDPIGFTDSKTGRTFVSQLLFVCSGAAFTDDDFKSPVTPSEGCGSGINGFDHQTFGGGPYPKGMSGLTSYPHAVYYCSQAQALVLGGATCARSDTGGLAFNPPVEIFHNQCSGLHGHVRVAPNDGTVYVPNDNCHGKQGLAVSRDAGQTWTVHRIPDSYAGESDPSVSAGKDGTVYFGYSDGTGRAKIAVSRDHGATWSTSKDAGRPFGVRNTEFAEVIAGDGDRAAFAFLGTSTRGSTQAASFGKNKAATKYVGGEWHLYVATTYDRGRHWTTVDATPNDPVQRGCIWNSGGSNDCRNLLDFNDITVTKKGRVLVGYADGCLNACVSSRAVGNNKFDDQGAIARQMTGRGLFAAYDPKPLSAGAGSAGAGSGAGNGSRTTTASASGLPNTGGSPLLPIGGAVLVAAAVAVAARHGRLSSSRV